MVLGHLPVNFYTLVTFAYTIQIRHAVVALENPT